MTTAVVEPPLAGSRADLHRALTDPETPTGRPVGFVLGALIGLNVLAVVLETEPALYNRFRGVFAAVEVLSVAAFAIEYLARAWSCVEDPRYRQPVVGRLRYMLTPMALVDLASMLPSLLPGGTWDLRFLRAARLLRLARALKLVRYSRALRVLGSVVRRRQSDLAVTAFVGAIMLLTASSLMYFAEHEAQPKVFRSIPAALWWGVMTLTTVGYGDVFPVTPLGKAIASLASVFGIALFALPTGIVATGFAEELRQDRVCPHCGRSFRETTVTSQEEHG